MNRNTTGATLVETLVALVVLGIGLLAVVPMFLYASRDNSTGSDLGLIGAMATGRMEQLRELPYGDPLLTVGGSLTGNVTTGGTSYFDDADPDYLVRWEITANPSPARTKVVRVRAIALRAAVGKPKRVTLATVRGDS